MAIPTIFWLIKKGVVFKLIHVHYGFGDRCLIWIVNKKIYDILFIKIR